MNSSAAENDSEAFSGPSYDSFGLLLERNIFDPDRRKREERREPPPKPPKSESFSLQGTMIYADKALAVFNGSNSDFQGVRHLNETIAGYEIVELNMSEVKLVKDGKTVALRVGMGMKRRGEDEWALSEDSTRNFTGYSKSKGNDSGLESASANEGSSSGSSPSDLLKKLMERRKQELNQ